MQFLASFQVCSQLRPSITYLHRTVLTWGGDRKRVSTSPQSSCSQSVGLFVKIAPGNFCRNFFWSFLSILSMPCFQCSFSYSKPTTVTALLDFKLIELRNARWKFFTKYSFVKIW